VILSVYKGSNLLDEINIDISRIVESDDNEVAYYIGRAEDCHILLEDPLISRYHAKIVKSGEGWMIFKESEFADLRINGNTIKEYNIKNGDILNIPPYSIGFMINQNEVLSDTSADDISEEISTEPVAAEVSEQEIVPQPEDTLDDLISSDSDAPEAVEFVDEVKDGQEGDEASVLESDFKLASDIEEEGDGENFEFGEEGDSDGDYSEDSSDEGHGDSDDEGGFDDDGSFDDEMELSDEGDQSVEDYDPQTQQFQSFANFSLKLSGEFAPYDKYTLEDNEVFFGRDPSKCKVLLSDTEVSSVHAAIRKKGLACELEDLNSSNGTILNGERINKAMLRPGDEFLIGSTSFILEIDSDLLKSEEDRLMPVEENQIIEREEIIEEEVSLLEDDEDSSELNIDFDTQAEGGKAGKQSILEKLKTLDRKQLLIGVVIVLGALSFLGDDDNPDTASSTKKGEKEGKSRKIGKGGDAKDKGKNDADEKNKSANITKAALARLSDEQKSNLNSRYILGKDLLERGKYKEAIYELEEVSKVVPGYKETTNYLKFANEGLAEVEAEAKKIQEQLERDRRAKRVKELVTLAKESVKKKEVIPSEAYFAQILELDPENLDVPSLKMQLDAFKKEKERKEIELAQKKSERDRQVNSLAPGKTAYLKKEWFKSIVKLEEFLRLKNLDEDLVKEASAMLDTSKKSLDSLISPILGKARSLKEGQDLKGAYQSYFEVMKIDPSNVEALNQTSNISDILEHRARVAYRGALISESLSLYEEAKEKFQEVKQISPVDSSYYKKADLKLKKYLE
jgi:pSer/pThr/pTyr-binding forkhead associated (FHA) protein